MLFFNRCKIQLSCIYKNKNWLESIPDLECVSKKVLVKIFRALNMKQNESMEINILLTNDKEIQTFNKEYRNKNLPTNVLSFETGDEFLIGDIVMSFDTLKKEAMGKKISIKNHYIHLFIHGVLHLLGFDHISDDDASEMEFFEVKILEELKIENPYE